MQVEHGKPCPTCGEKLKKYAWHARCHHCGADFESLNAPPPPETVQITLKPGQKEYMVITQADQ